MSTEYQMNALRTELAETQRALWALQAAVEQFTSLVQQLLEHAQMSVESKELSRG